MEKKVLLFILVLSLIFILPLTFAAQEDINNAYACLEDKIDEKTCDGLSVTEKIFTSLAVNRCSSELRAEAKDGECWPEASCNIKTTAQAVLALKTSAAKNWLIAQNRTPSEITWYLQIESSLESTCTITYDDNDYSIELGEDKKIDSAAGNCLSLSSLGYWLEIASDCYEEEFEISCDESFITNLLFRIDISSTIHVSEKTSSATGGGTTTEKINSFCFIDSGNCDYEGSLWAALALDSMGEEISSYMPYLVTMADANDEYFPEVFLYALGYEDFHYDIIEKQASNGYWSISGDKYYDTALALYPFMYKEFDEKEKAKEWLLLEQEDDGCWNSGNILDTAFILHSVWAKENPDPPVTTTCSDLGYYCMSTADCDDSGGNILNYSCSSYYVCCDTQKIEKTCAEAGGQICTGGEECTGTTLEAADTYYCCFAECEEPGETKDYTCEVYNGFCEPYECGEGYVQSSEYDCEDYGDICCMPKDKPGPNAFFWILIILIILVVLGIIFRHKLREFWFRIKPGSKKFTPPRRDLGFPHVFSTIPRRRIMSRRVMPAAHRPAPRPAPQSPSRHHGELDEVLQKLKDMGK